MYIYPAIDLYAGQAVRLYRGDYAQMTVYSREPVRVARDFAQAGAKHIHLVDLEGAKTGKPENLTVIRAIVEEAGLFSQVGGGIRDMSTVQTYLNAGVDRVILGTAAVKDPDFLKAALDRFSDGIAVGVDLKDGLVATHGWTQTSDLRAEEFFGRLEDLGVKTVICTDISRDGAMQGTNRGLYRQLSQAFDLDLIASGGVSSLEDVAALRDMGLHGAILGKALYEKKLSLAEAVKEEE